MSKCKFCGQVFLTRAEGSNDFCSSSCRRNYYLTQPMPPLAPGQKRCQECGKIFNYFDPDSDGEFCSDTCHILYCLFIPSSPSQGPPPPVAGPSYPRPTPAPTRYSGPPAPLELSNWSSTDEDDSSSSSQSNNGQITAGILVGVGVITFLAIVIGIETTIMIAIGLTGVVVTISFNH